MASNVLADLLVRIDADSASLRSEIGKAQDGLRQLGGASSKWGEQIGREHTSLIGTLREFSMEQRQQGRMARFYASELLSIVPAAQQVRGALTGALGLGIEALAGGAGIGLAIEGVKLLAEHFFAVSEEEKKAKEKADEFFKAIKERGDEAGKALQELADKFDRISPATLVKRTLATTREEIAATTAALIPVGETIAQFAEQGIGPGTWLKPGELSKALEAQKQLQAQLQALRETEAKQMARLNVQEAEDDRQATIKRGQAQAEERDRQRKEEEKREKDHQDFLRQQREAFLQMDIAATQRAEEAKARAAAEAKKRGDAIIKADEDARAKADEEALKAWDRAFREGRQAVEQAQRDTASAAREWAAPTEAAFHGLLQDLKDGAFTLQSVWERAWNAIADTAIGALERIFQVWLETKIALAIAGPAAGPNVIGSILSVLPGAPAGMNVSVQNFGTSKEFAVERVSRDEVRIIARDEVARGAEDVVASRMYDANSRIHTAARRSLNVTTRR